MPHSSIEDPNRLAALAASGLMDSPPEETFDRFTRLAARLLACPISLVSLVARDRQFFKSSFGLSGPAAEQRGTSLDYSVCKYVVSGDAPFAVPDARKSDLLRENPAVTERGLVSYLGVPIRSGDGMVLGSFCVADQAPHEWSTNDLAILEDLGNALATEVRLRECSEALRDLLQERETLQGEREKMIRLLVHDLRSPIAAVISTMQVIEDDPGSTEENLDLLQSARAGAEEVLGMINQMMELHRMESGHLVLDRREFSVNQLLRDVARQFVPLIEAAEQDLEVRCDEGDLRILADPDILKRVIVNLLANAIKYAGRGASITLSGQHAAGSILFRVEDNGPGIPAECRETIFESFNRGEKTLEGRDTSFGLGLSFCRLAVEAHRGKIWADSSPSGGGLFQVQIPL